MSIFGNVRRLCRADRADLHLGSDFSGGAGLAGVRITFDFRGFEIFIGGAGAAAHRGAGRAEV